MIPEVERADYDSSNKIKVVYFYQKKVVIAVNKPKTNGSGCYDNLSNIYFLNVAPKFAFPCIRLVFFKYIYDSLVRPCSICKYDNVIPILKSRFH